MKVAICLYGYYNNRVDPNAGSKGNEYIKDKIYSECESKGIKPDVFIHSWDMSQRDIIKSKYQPQISQFENQIDFNGVAKFHGIDEAAINGSFNRKGTTYESCTINATLSFLYSRSRAIEFAIKYGENNDFKYDCIVVCRFDLGQRSGWHRGYNVSQIDFSLNNDMNMIYSSMWRQLNAGLGDQWFYSGHDNIEKLGKMYDMALKDYFHLGSKYEKAINGGWVDSNENDQFSNEVLKSSSKRSKELVKYPRWQMINNHIMHKWHFIATEMYNNSKYLGEHKP